MTDKTIQTHKIDIEGMDCADCALRIEKEVGKLSGVKQAKVDFVNARLKVQYNKNECNLPDIESSVQSAGYRVKKPDKRQSTTLIVKGMDCAEESRPIENRLQKMEGISEIRFKLIANKLIVEHEIPTEEIQQALKEMGFESRLAEHSPGTGETTFWRRRKSLILTIISGLLAVSGTLFHYFQVRDEITVPLLLLAIVIGGYPIALKGLKEARRLTLGMNFLMSVAVIGAMIIGEWTEAAMVVFLFALAQLLESYSVQRARKSIQSLMKLAPNSALVKTPEGDTLIPAEEVEIGDILIIKPGARIPLDGTVTAGLSSVDQSPITGESIPQEKYPGQEVFAGSINQQGTLEVKVGKRYNDTTLAHIIHLVEEAQAHKAPTQQFVEKFAKYYTPAVVSLAILVAGVPPLLFGAPFLDWFYRSLVVLVISCPCALVISTPVTIVSGLTNSARSGVLIKGGAHIENFAHIKALAFDKTGTLTAGKPVVKDVIALNRYSEKQLLEIAASIESRSEHPFARAIVEYADRKGITPGSIHSFQALTGQGATGTIGRQTYFIGNHRLFEQNGWCDSGVHGYLESIEMQQYTAVLIGNKKTLLGIIAIGDEIREKAATTIENLQKEGIRRIIMLTGDNQATARAIAREIGVTDVRAELLPGDKVAAVQEFLRTYGQVAMVGDGINDAPALATATIGISMGASGTDTALETADIALMNDDLSKLEFLRKLSRKTAFIIKENIFVALSLKAVFLLLAIPGLATLWMAVFADMGASLMVTFNGLRALRSK